MDFLRFVLGSIFISFVGLFLYRYEQLNRFQMMPHASSLFVIDRKTNRVTRLDERGFKVILKGSEPFLQENFVEAPSLEAMLPTPSEPLPEAMPESLPPEVPQVEAPQVSQEPYLKPSPNSYERSQEQLQERPSSSFVSPEMKEKAMNAAKDALYNEATSEAGSKLREAYQGRHQRNEDQ